MILTYLDPLFIFMSIYNYDAKNTACNWHRVVNLNDAIDTTESNSAVFNDTAESDFAVFKDTAESDSAVFNDTAESDSAVFNDNAELDSAVFNDTAESDSAVFNDTTESDSAVFNGTAESDSAVFNDAALDSFIILKIWKSRFKKMNMQRLCLGFGGQENLVILFL